MDGKWVESESGETFSRANPADPKEIIGMFQKGNEEDVNKAVDAAENAFKKWSSVPPPKRGQILLKIAQLLRKNKEELARTMTREMGKVLIESRGDVQEAIDIAEYMAGEGRRMFGRTTTSGLKDNRDTGQKILKEAGIKRVGLELGGKNATIVMDDADLNLALDGIIWGAFGTTGQMCTACSRVIST